MNEPMSITIDTIPHREQEYDTAGNYWFDPNKKNFSGNIKVSHLNNLDYEFIVAIHELVEMYFVKKADIDQASITDFDKHFEKMRYDYPELVGDMEPGDHEKAPYNKQHKLASMFERWVADNLAREQDKDPNIFWEEYTEAVNKLNHVQEER